MVKGNWERRAEKAAIRREEAKDKKEQRKSATKVAGSESVFNRVIHDESICLEEAFAWLESSDHEEVCKMWFRTETCKLGKKCKLFHTKETIAHLVGPDKKPLSMEEKDDNDEQNKLQGRNDCHILKHLKYITKGSLNLHKYITNHIHT